MLLIGDVHGKFRHYRQLIEDVESSTIQLGDMGAYNSGDATFLDKLPEQHKFFRGNHDNPGIVSQCKNHIGSGSHTVEERSIFVVEGAGSIIPDQVYRTTEVNFWLNEEETPQKLRGLAAAYLYTKPSVMLSHDCPTEVINRIHGDNRWPTRTSTFLQSMFLSHQPELWVFGHHHVSFDEKINGTRFVCLNELEVFKL